MGDIAQAYYLCHTADRNGDFSLSPEFGAVRDTSSLSRHPQLASLEPGVLEVAAQMSQVPQSGRGLLRRKRRSRQAFLRERQQEADSQEAAIAAATKRLEEIKL